VRRNGGRPGAAQAPNAIRAQLYRFTSWDHVGVDLAALDLLDLGNVRTEGGLEACQQRLGEVIAALLRSAAVPIVLGGGHETAYGHYLGYVSAGLACTIINIDAHLDVRPYPHGGHSGSPFRQALEHSTHPLGRGRYIVLGAQRQAVARAHAEYVEQQGGRIHWWEPAFDIAAVFAEELRGGPAVLVTVDADAFRQADVPGVSAPSPVGIDGARWPELALRAGADPFVRSIEVVEVNPDLDRDQQTTRWAALGVRQFLVGVAGRSTKPPADHTPV
jgi:formiminoglutamase